MGWGSDASPYSFSRKSAKHMKIKLAIVLLYMLYACPGCQYSYFSKVSTKISECQLENGIRKQGFNGFFQIRKELESYSKTTFFPRVDTMYIIESYDIQSGEVFSQILDTESSLSYRYLNHHFTFNYEDTFDKYMIELIKKWDIETIRKEEKASYLTPEDQIYASRAIYSGHKISVECISFKDFYNPEKSRKVSPK